VLVVGLIYVVIGLIVLVLGSILLQVLAQGTLLLERGTCVRGDPARLVHRHGAALVATGAA
jgi:hypothetical protein